jgi:uncharacterized protein YraI
MTFRLKAALGAGLLLMSAGAASAATATAVTALNVRSGPGGSYPVVDTMPGGETVNVLGCEAGWCEISMGRDGTGFASESYLDLGGGRPARSTVVIEDSEPTVITGLSIGGYWGDNPYYYDDGFYYYGGRWYGERPGRPGWERSWSRDHHRGGGGRDFGDRGRPDRGDRGRPGRDFGNRDAGDRGGRDRSDRTRVDAGRSEARVDSPARDGGGRGAGRGDGGDRGGGGRDGGGRGAGRGDGGGGGDRGDRVGLDRAR